jgi:hypothetical protein
MLDALEGSFVGHFNVCGYSNIVIAKERQRLWQSERRDRHTLLRKVRDDKINTNESKQTNHSDLRADARIRINPRKRFKNAFLEVIKSSLFHGHCHRVTLPLLDLFVVAEDLVEGALDEVA